MVFSVTAPPGTRLKQVVISPDGRSLAFAAESASGESHLWLRRLDSRDARMLEGTEGALEPFWSPDSRFIGFFTEAQLWKLEAASGAVEALASTTDTRGGAWRADGTIVFGGARLNRVAASGGAVSTALDVDGASGENASATPRSSPTGRTCSTTPATPRTARAPGCGCSRSTAGSASTSRPPRRRPPSTSSRATCSTAATATWWPTPSTRAVSSSLASRGRSPRTSGTTPASPPRRTSARPRPAS